MLYFNAVVHKIKRSTAQVQLIQSSYPILPSHIGTVSDPVFGPAASSVASEIIQYTQCAAEGWVPLDKCEFQNLKGLEKWLVLDPAGYYLPTHEFVAQCFVSSPRELFADPNQESYPVFPLHIHAGHQIGDVFKSYEPEVCAPAIVRAFQKRGMLWQTPCPEDEVRREYTNTRIPFEDGLAVLKEAGLVFGTSAALYISHDFVARAFFSSPAPEFVREAVPVFTSA